MVVRSKPKMIAPPKKATVEDPVAGIVSAIRSVIGEDGALVLGDDRMACKIKGVLPFGCLGIDRSIGRGGVPLGRLTILHGGEGSGKTTAALQLVVQCQKRGGVAVYIDKEYKLDPDWATALGVDTTRLVLSQPKHLEATLRLVRGVIAYAAKVREERHESYPILIILDSINACVSKAVYESDEEDIHVAPEARVWSKQLPRLIEDASKESIALVFISQIRKKLNVMFGDDAVLAGGEAPKFYASCIGMFRRVGKVKNDKGATVANKVEVEWKKNQIAPPFRKHIFYVRFPPSGAGFDVERSLLDVAESLGVVRKKGAALVFGDVALGIGYDAARTRLAKKPELAEKIQSKIDEVTASGLTVVDDGTDDDVEDEEDPPPKPKTKVKTKARAKSDEE